MEHFISLLVRSVFVDNMVFAFFLGMCSFLAVSKSVKTAIGLGVAVVFVQVITLPVNYLLQTEVLGANAIIEGVEDPYSLGYSLRTLYACGCDVVVLPRHLPAACDSALCKSSAGASELLNIHLGDTAEIAAQFKKCGYRIACAAIPDSLPCFEADLSLPLLLVIGGEKRGISSKLLQMKDLNVRIPYGTDFMGSLSTSSAVSILAYEVLRQNSAK